MAKREVDYFDLKPLSCRRAYDFRYWLDRETGEILEEWARDRGVEIRRG
jgi:hypothetical protein